MSRDAATPDLYLNSAPGLLVNSRTGERLTVVSVESYTLTVTREMPMGRGVSMSLFGFRVSVARYTWSKWTVYRNRYGIWLELGKFQLNITRPPSVSQGDYL